MIVALWCSPWLTEKQKYLCSGNFLQMVRLNEVSLTAILMKDGYFILSWLRPAMWRWRCTKFRWRVGNEKNNGWHTEESPYCACLEIKRDNYNQKIRSYVRCDPLSVMKRRNSQLYLTCLLSRQQIQATTRRSRCLSTQDNKWKHTKDTSVLGSTTLVPRFCRITVTWFLPGWVALYGTVG